MCRAHARFEELVRRLAGLQDRLTPWSGTVYRNCAPRYATNTDLLGGSGSSLYGGRWNPARIRTVYASMTPQASMEETLAQFRRRGLDISDAMPRMFVAIRVDLQRVLDLTDTNTRRRLSLSLPKALREDWRQTQASGTDGLAQSLGRAAFATGVEAMIVPSSTCPKGRNLICFPANLTAQSSFVIHRADELPGG
ncbi:MAG: RES family NAD+ phosphorylase [Planctomycetota bacterium]